MCGIAGLLEKNTPLDLSAVRESVRRMTSAIIHRGPDDGDVWVDQDAGIALGHRRLSIVDLSPAGHQPMPSACGRYVIAFNGEVYNYKEIRKELDELNAAPAWRGHSDTEVMLAAISHWGLDVALGRFVGMFAFGLWDRKERILHLVRDRLGEKPLYYGWVGNTFLFGSELKALRAHPAWRGEIDRNALTLLLRHNYIPAPYSIYKGIHKVLPGSVVTIRPNASAADPVTARPYWSALKVAESGIASPFTGSDAEACDRLESLMRRSVGLQMVADVPLGAFLSGGVDSSTIVALMQAQSARAVKTFTIGFTEEAFDEAKHAKAVARHLGTDHTELYVTPKDALDVIPRLPQLYDEPFSDSSQVPTFLVSQLARQHVTVSLSGDAGDELFCGYHRYFLGRDVWGKIGWMPKSVRAGLAGGLTAMSPDKWGWLFQKLGPVLPQKIKKRNPGDKLHKLAEILLADNPQEFYQELVSHWKSPASVVLGAVEPATALSDYDQIALSNFTERMMYLDTVSYLPDDILVKVDRASMGVSLESRVPLLDHRIVEFAWQVPLSMKIRDGQGKWLLRQVLYKYVPKELIERPKMGFGVPIDSWLRGPLREWGENLLDESRLKAEGFFDPAPIRAKWTEHLSGQRNWQYYLWDILMFQAWLDEYR